MCVKCIGGHLLYCIAQNVNKCIISEYVWKRFNRGSIDGFCKTNWRQSCPFSCKIRLYLHTRLDIFTILTHAVSLVQMQALILQSPMNCTPIDVIGAHSSMTTMELVIGFCNQFCIHM